MNFLEGIFQRLKSSAARPVIQEVREGRMVPARGQELLAMVRAARGFFTRAGLKKGDRCALLGHNGACWAALDLALMADGIIVVPLYARQAPAELAAMMKDCSPSLICCGDPQLRDAICRSWPGSPPICLFDDALAASAPVPTAGDSPAPLAPGDPLTIIYTSGTSGEPKGVVLNVGNLDHMLPCTTARLDALMDTPPGGSAVPDSVFHYLPFCFAGSWILLLSCLSRHSVLTLSTDLTRLAGEMKVAAPNYFLNVPALLERVRAGVEEQVSQRGGAGQKLYAKGKAAWFRRQQGQARAGDRLWRALAGGLVFPAIRKKLGPELKALICGSAPLALETQLFFLMLGIRVLQVYGLTETTAICTMDDPRAVVPGRVGPAIPGIEMKLGEGDEILVRGPNIFPGYWNRPEETARVLRDEWFHTGDQGEVDASGNWKIIGRVKNLIVLNSGHKVAPEPLEDKLLRAVPGAQQVVLAGNRRSFLAAVVTGSDVQAERVESAVASLNAEQPHYRRIHAFHICREPFTIENGLLTANGKLRREAIAAALRAEIEALYQRG